jgi:DNA repair photolyase
MMTIPAKTIITRKPDNTWFGMDYNMNIYKGCSHGCIYCDSRSDCYQVKDFDTIRMKENAIKIIRSELRDKKKTGVIGTGSMSDPYNPLEVQYKLTRQSLELIDYYNYGIGIATKSDLIIRDIDVLQRIKEHSPVICKITVTAADDELSSVIEPGVCVSSERFTAIRQLSEAGIFAGILMTPLLPFLTDTPENVTQIIQAAYQSGAKFIYSLFGVTLRAGQREYFYQKLDQLFPGKQLKQKYMKQYGSSYECHSPRELELESIFKTECHRLGILYKMEDIIKAYQTAYQFRQLTLFRDM